MSFNRGAWALALAGAALIGVAFLTPPRATRSAVSSSSASATSVPTPPALHFGFDFDCSAFAPASNPRCPELGAPQRALLDLANTYRVSAAPSWSTELAAAPSALSGVAALDPKKLAPLERAALQNAALFLLSASTSDQAAAARSTAASARALVKRLALSREEATALPTSDAVLAPWLGPGAAWQQGLEPRLLHTTAEAFARAHRTLFNAGTLADVVRMVLVGPDGVPYVSDLVQRVAIRRTEGHVVHVCIAELDPSPSCSSNGQLSPLDLARGQRVATRPNASVPCVGCHHNNRPGSASFSAASGFAFADDKAEKLIQTKLEAALRP